MDCIRAYRIRLYPTDDQKNLINRFIGLFRYVYNWTIDQEKMLYESTGHFTQNWEIHKLFKEMRDGLSSDDPLKTYPLNTANRAINNAIAAFKNFFQKISKYPAYKTKKTEYRKNAMSFSVRGQRLSFYEDGVAIEGFGYNNHVKCDDYGVPKFDGVTYYNCTVVNDHEEYWLIVNVKMSIPFIQETTDEVIGIDVGLYTMAMLSNGKAYKSPDMRHLLKKAERQKRQLQRDIYRRVNLAKSMRTKYDDIPKTKNEEKREISCRNTLRKIANTQNTYSHQVSKEIVDMMPKAIVMEKLNISGMVLKKNRKGRGKKFGERIYHARLATFRDQIAYKAAARGIEVVYADMFFPSSQICSNCGARHKTGERTYVCPECGFTIDRDLNAAINLRNYYFSSRT